MTTRTKQEQPQRRRTRREPVPLGRGDFVVLGADNVEARARYLAAVADLVPEALRELAAISVDDDAAFRLWTQDRGFTDAWASEFARQQMGLWKTHPNHAGKWLTLGGGAEWRPEVVLAWDPVDEPKALFLQRAREIAAGNPAAGLAPTPKADPRVFEWTALRQVAGWAYEAIAGQYQNANGYPGEPAICVAVVSLSGVMALTLRKTRRGRKLP